MTERPHLNKTGALGKVAEELIKADADSRPILPVSPAPSHLLLQIGAPPEPIVTIGVEVKDQIHLGRADASDDPAIPKVDLSPYGATGQGVSRHHAAIVKLKDSLHVRDTKSRNGTILNDIPLIDQQVYPLNDGDTLRLGQMQIVVRFVYND
jgi:pSer/pThr/pTyr-binding forkhead associated (FHA) protein